MMASSTTAPRAITSPASVIVLIVVPAPVEHEHGRHQRERDGQQADQGDPPLEQEQPEDHHDQQEAEDQRLGQVVDRQLDEVGLLEDVRVERDVRQPGLELLDGVLDAARSARSVLAHGSFSTTSSMPGLGVDHGVADERLVVLLDHGHVAERGLSFGRGALDRHLGQVGGGDDGQHVADASRWFGVSIVPPVPMTLPVENRSRPESTASAVVSITWSRRDAVLRPAWAGSTCTVISCSRSFQIATLATPGTWSSRARIVQ